MFDAPTMISRHVVVKDCDSFRQKVHFTLSCGHKNSFDDVFFRKVSAYLGCDICTERARLETYYQNW